MNLKEQDELNEIKAAVKWYMKNHRKEGLEIWQTRYHEFITNYRKRKIINIFKLC